MTPLFIMFYKLRALGPAWQLFPVAALGTWALVVNGTFFAAMSLRTRSREIMLPLLLFPISIPALLAMVNATTAILTGEMSANSGLCCLPPTTWCLLSLSAFVRTGAERRMKRCKSRAFPHFRLLLTAVLLSYALYEALVAAPTEQTMGNVQRIFYYHVPSAWTAFLLFFINFVGSIQYLVRRNPIGG